MEDLMKARLCYGRCWHLLLLLLHLIIDSRAECPYFASLRVERSTGNRWRFQQSDFTSDSISDRFPNISDDEIIQLVNSGRDRAENLFGVSLGARSLLPFSSSDEVSKRNFKRPLNVTEYPVIGRNDSAWGLGKYGFLLEKTVPISQRAVVLLDITKGLTESRHLNRGTRQFLDDITGLSVPQFRTICPVPKERPAVSLDDPFNSPNPPDCVHNKYQGINGHCNNVAWLNRGKDSTIYRRLLEANYADGVADVRVSATGQKLPSARSVSLEVFDNLEGPGVDLSALNAHFGQFLAHDMISSPSSKTADGQIPKCCGDSGKAIHPDCLPIEIPPNDQISRQHGRTCMEFVRTLPGVRPGCTLGPREQINQNTHFIDASTIYGSNDQEASAVRSFEGGQLKNIRPFPQSPHFSILTGDASSCSGNGLVCFKGGDKRTNVQPGLTMMHTIWMRQHNRLASILSTVNSHWNDETLFQEARRILIAQLQHIVYSEFLPNFLGKDMMNSFGLTLLPRGLFHGYNISANPAVTSEFAVAGFRLHSTIPPVLALRNPADNSRVGVKPLRESWFHPFDLYSASYFSECAAGMIGAVYDKQDQHYADDVRNHLFQRFPEVIGLDMPAIDIQRGRDHGLQPYVKYRALCQLRVPKSFRDLKKMNIMPAEVVDRLATAYRSVEDVDLYVGGTVENHVAGGRVGPTFGCIIGEQFYRSRTGDRFWYENDLPLISALLQAQVDEIRKSSFAQVMCSNVDGLQNIQPKILLVADSGDNQQVPCSSLPDIDFSIWRDA
ncbi:hypothetical protein RvY_01743 [Ramazzottius varieornatus]|uniref:Peroxidase n=1 Tax=Ramazzottius varieornatus TaxID=947166 RepID=A0A1D1UHG6_RAMVA|nr:hypothetical protein RvY_01743 [Ramazzottius varieornatus]